MIKVKIKDIVDIFNGSTPSTSVSENFDGHISWITPKDISDQKTKYINRGERNITEKGLNSIGGNLLPKGTILFSSRAPIGLMSICTKETATNQGFKNMVCKKDKIDNEYLFYLLKTQISKIQELGTGTTFKEVSKSTIESFEIYIEENVPTQQKIAAVLSALDDKIEVNNKINAALEAMAKTLYDYWFVQFEFPITNESHPELVSGSHPKGYKSAGGKMVYNKTLKREIPEGWEVKFVDDLLRKNESNLKLNAKEYSSEGKFPIVDQSTDFIAGFSDKVDYKIDISVDFPAIVFGDHTRILKLINFDFIRGADGTQVLFSNNERLPQILFYHSLLKIDLSNYGYARHFKFLKDSMIILPHLDLANKFERKANIFYKKILNNQKQNQELAQLRDWLLPMLMNGQVTVGEAEEQLGMVAETGIEYKKK